MNGTFILRNRTREKEGKSEI